MSTFVINESASIEEINEAIDLRLSFARGFCDMVATHETLNHLAEVGGICETAYGNYELLGQVEELMRALRMRLKEADPSEKGGAR